MIHDAVYSKFPDAVTSVIFTEVISFVRVSLRSAGNTYVAQERVNSSSHMKPLKQIRALSAAVHAVYCGPCC
jgi:hypothetical protein